MSQSLNCSNLGHLVPEQRPPTVLNLVPETSRPDTVHSVTSSVLSLEESRGSRKAREKESRGLNHPRDGGRKDSRDSRSSNLPKNDEVSANLDILSLQLRGKSKELLAANLSQTKYFFKKLKRYIDFLSTPSETVAECRVKQQLAAKITKLLATEESRLELSSDVSRPESSVSAPSSRQIETDSPTFRIPPLPRFPERKPQQDLDSCPSSGNQTDQTDKNLRHWKTSRTRSEEKFERREKVTSHRTAKDVDTVDELNRKRIEHLKNLKREIRILEKIERKLSKDSVFSSTSSESVTGGQLPDSPTRKLTFVKTSARGTDTTTVTENLQSRDTLDRGEQVFKVPDRQEKGVQVDKKGLQADRKGLQVDQQRLQVDKKGRQVDKRGQKGDKKGFQVDKKGLQVDIDESEVSSIISLVSETSQR